MEQLLTTFSTFAVMLLVNDCINWCLDKADMYKAPTPNAPILRREAAEESKDLANTLAEIITKIGWQHDVAFLGFILLYKAGVRAV
ncbi:hypothetical protein N7533_001775 [Penicillium manginii]|uniref:uncharacterized protein n=1 Tax=Penicillium manginii TaxID=203109 RepID=UPI00254888B8|nr:uncharacterized protein N7533_001775 [Penicillium manginii]KAJ5763094.1 hypothetical protein N7533_001775 [Penicillium manginii]